MKISPSELGPRLGDEDEELQEQQKEEFVAFCRVYSGRIESGKQVKFVSCKRDLFHVYPLLIAPSIIDNLITYTYSCPNKAQNANITTHFVKYLRLCFAYTTLD